MAEFDDGSSTESEYYDDGEEAAFDSSNGTSMQAKEQSIAPSLALSNDALPEITPSADTRVSPTQRMRVETKEQISDCRQVRDVDECSSTRFVSPFAMLAQLPTVPHANAAPSLKTFPTTSVSATSGNAPSTSERSHRPSLERLKTNNSAYSGPDEQLSQPLKKAPANVVSPASSDRSTRSRLSDTKSYTVRESQTKHSEVSSGAMKEEEVRCSGCAMNLPSKYMPDSASTHQCTCCKRWLCPKEWFSESELAQSYDWRCIRCAEGHRLKRKRHEDEAYCDREAKTFKKDDSGFRTETYAKSELLALESERRDLNTTIRNLQDILKIVRRLVNQQGKLANRLSPTEQKRHGIHHPVQRIITQNNSALARLRGTFTTKYTVIVSRLPVEERLQMFREEIPLLKLAVKYATAEIVAFSYLLRRCDQVLPTNVENFVVNYSRDKGSENAMEELVNSLTGQKAASVCTPKTSVEAGTSR